MSYLSGIDFRKKFAPLFEINPLLTDNREIQKAKFPKVKPREIILLDDTDDEAESDIIVDERRQVSDNPDEGTADVKNQPQNADIPGSKRSFSVYEISDDSDADISDYDFGYDAGSDPEIYHGSQSSSSPSVIRPLAKVKSTKKPDQESETRTTPWISKIAGTLFGRSLRPVERNKDEKSWELALKEYREAMSLARRTGKEFLRESREKIMEIEYRAGDSILVELGT
ncbi:predicted protein [Sclerotinia sclerotiorum 1980 UF-70]|uniref:Uncharacterized protein n=1 Tax=Sclerotinia sclerotiorum (strain ATCC 18683 / 1980 / Ss-1) TaxID=665079 RepID=A7EA37_SCLS1|nr:predicted protein [Sclerotinia sclerotiorum 1980 UF-70]EDN99315.1 predicted protein [Sclerotinia sclerotiorum 1980 UF-70]